MYCVYYSQNLKPQVLNFGITFCHVSRETEPACSKWWWVPVSLFDITSCCNMNIFARSPAKQHGLTRRICGKWYLVFDRSVHLSMAEVPFLDKLEIVTKLSRSKGLAPVTNVVSPPLDDSAGYLLSYDVWTLINIILFDQGICNPGKDWGGQCHFRAFGLFHFLQCFLLYLWEFNMYDSHDDDCFYYYKK